MPDISMCIDNDCKKRAECYRYRAVMHEYRQSMFACRPSKAEDGCQYYWPLEGDRTGIRPMDECEAAAKRWWKTLAEGAKKED
jgi:hypothetical protein